jgi:hypothetical protein
MARMKLMVLVHPISVCRLLLEEYRENRRTQLGQVLSNGNHIHAINSLVSLS